MKHLTVVGWVRRHKIMLVVLALITIASLVVAAFNRPARDQGEERRLLATAVEAHKSAERSLESKQVAEADRLCRAAIETLEPIAVRSGDPRIRVEQASAYETLALIQNAMDQPDQAQSAFQEAIKRWTSLLVDDQDNVVVRKRLAKCLARYAPVLRKSGRWEEAEHRLSRGVDVCETRLTEAPPSPLLNPELVLIRNELGLVYQHARRPDEAVASFALAESLQKRLILPSSPTGEDRELLISIMVNHAEALSAAKKQDAALHVLEEARELAERLKSDYPSNARYLALTATLLENQAGLIERDPNRAAEARALLERAQVIRESIVAQTPAPEERDKLAETCRRLADWFLAANSFDKTEEYQRKELSHRSRLVKDHPGVAAFRFGRGQALHNLAELLRNHGRFEEALPLECEAVELLNGVYRENLLDEDHRRAVSFAYWTLCTLELERKDYRAAAESVAIYESIEPSGFEEAHNAAEFLCRCISLCRDDRGIGPAEKEKLVRSYTDRAINALQTAVRLGFRDLGELTTSKLYAPLRGRPEFARVVHDVQLLSDALNDR